MIKPLFILVSLLLAVGMAACNRNQDIVSSPSPSPEPTTALTSPASSPPSPTTATARLVKVTVRSGKVETSDKVVEVKVGETVRIEVDADISDELHVHAYDEKKPVVAGQVAVLEFVADIPGSFEVELEQHKLDLFELRVT